MRVGVLAIASSALIAVAACQSTAAPSSTAAVTASGDWNQVVAAANQEGAVAVSGSGNNDLPTVLTGEFNKRYPKIRVDYSPDTGAQATPKLLAEHSSSKSFTDITSHGADGSYPLLDASALADMSPYIAGPDVQPNKWRDGQLTFSDKQGKRILVYGGYAKLGPAYTTNQVNPKDITSWQDLLDPKWKGKIIMGDPSSAGSGQAMAWYWLVTPGFGKPFVEQLLKQQDVTLSRNDQQAINSVAHGERLLGIGIGDNVVVSAVNKGLGVSVVDWRQLKDPAYMTAGVGTLSVMDKPPHPNAAKVYVDWLLSQEGQSAISNATGLPSLRQDVPADKVFPALRTQSGVDYIADFGEDNIRNRETGAAYIRSLVNSRQ